MFRSHQSSLALFFFVQTLTLWHYIRNSHFMSADADTIAVLLIPCSIIHHKIISCRQILTSRQRLQAQTIRNIASDRDTLHCLPFSSTYLLLNFCLIMLRIRISVLISHISHTASLDLFFNGTHICEFWQVFVEDHTVDRRLERCQDADEKIAGMRRSAARVSPLQRVRYMHIA
jgi:hypothetical protein